MISVAPEWPYYYYYSTILQGLHASLSRRPITTDRTSPDSIFWRSCCIGDDSIVSLQQSTMAQTQKKLGSRPRALQLTSSETSDGWLQYHLLCQGIQRTMKERLKNRTRRVCLAIPFLQYRGEVIQGQSQRRFSIFYDRQDPLDLFFSRWEHLVEWRWD